jgi:hypothetical protein
MGKISDVFGKSLEVEANVDDGYSIQDQDIFDPGSHEAKLKEARAIQIPTIHNGNGKNKTQENKKKIYFVQKHSESDLIAEAVIVAGIPYFAVAIAKSNEITLERSIAIDDTNEYRPFESRAYLTKPYIFKSKQDFESCIKMARNETLDSSYRKVKAIWSKYVDADDFHISICAADTVFTYYQDKIGLTHYLFFVGNNGSGKSNNLTLLHFLAYRNFTSTDMTAANIYQFLGSDEEGQGTLCEDEADRIDEDRQKMAIYKNGYITGFPVARTDTSFGRKQIKLNTYCWKAFAAERFLDSLKARGFNQRTIGLSCVYGFPQYDISEVVNPAGEDEYQDLLNELNETRNLLLVYRLLHFKDKIPNIQLNIKNREKQLFKPVLRVFQNTDTLKELLPVISRYVSQRRETNANTLHAFLYRVIIELIKSQNSFELESSIIWNTLTDVLAGEFNPNKTLSYDTSDFGIISRKEITQILKDVFGAKPSKRHGESSRLIFDKAKLERIGKLYNLSIEVKVVAIDSRHCKNGEDGYDGVDVGLDKHLIKHGSNDKKAESSVDINKNHKVITENNKEITSGNQDGSTGLTADPPQPPHPTQTTAVVVLTTEEQQQPSPTRSEIVDMSDRIYRLGSTDNWACKHCKLKGDTWFMREHNCKGRTK